jgi:hypothetical protein
MFHVEHRIRGLRRDIELPLFAGPLLSRSKPLAPAQKAE